MASISIIVPVYKTENSINKCISSILSQTFTDFELLLIDDGSTDCCGVICETEAIKDSRIIVIHQSNQGVSVARNVGLDVMTGDYLGFVDSDDWIEPRMYEIMFNNSKKHQSNIVSCGIKQYDQDYRFIRESLAHSKKYGYEALMLSNFDKPNPIGSSCANKLFRIEAIKGLRFNEKVRIGEDRIFLFEAERRGCSVESIGDSLYCNYLRKGSATRMTNKYLVDLIKTDLIIQRETEKMGSKLSIVSFDKFFDDCMLCIDSIKRDGEYSSYVRYILTVMVRELLRINLKSRIPIRKSVGYFKLIIKEVGVCNTVNTIN